MLSYERLRTMATLVTAVAYFARLELGHTVKLNLLVRPIYQASKRIYGIPEFRFYAIAEGIKQVLFGRQKGIGKPPHHTNSPTVALPSGPLKNGESPANPPP